MFRTDLAEGKRIGFHARIEKRDLDLSIGDGLRLSDQLCNLVNTAYAVMGFGKAGCPLGISPKILSSVHNRDFAAVVHRRLVEGQKPSTLPAGGDRVTLRCTRMHKQKAQRCGVTSSAEPRRIDTQP
jgi:hypothetical protein